MLFWFLKYMSNTKYCITTKTLCQDNHSLARDSNKNFQHAKAGATVPQY